MTIRHRVRPFWRCFRTLTLVGITFALGWVGVAALGGNVTSNTIQFRDSSGVIATRTTGSHLDTTGPFFQSLGSNGRSCASCHQASDGWSITPQHLRQIFRATSGTDPVFRPNDGSTCPTTPVTTLDERREAYKLLLSKGLIRVELSIPPNAEFSLLTVDDPYDCTAAPTLSVYRRPLPSTNLPFLSTVMWDGRETFKGEPMLVNLAHQVQSATLGHAQAAHPPTQEQINQIVAFELSLFTAQIEDNDAGDLSVDGARGGPANLSTQQFFIGINDPLGQNPTGASFDPKVFDIYKAWTSSRGDDSGGRMEARRAVARGEAIFNTRPIAITGVAGLNDNLNAPVINGFCTTCHDSPNIGNHSVTAPLNIGLTDEAKRTPDLPLFTFQCNDGTIVKVSDPGRAMISGKCADLGKFKGPILRGLAARAPYFHNGAAATLEEAITFYDQRFDLHLTAREKRDLLAFLKTL